MPTVAEIKEEIKRLRGKSKDYPITGLKKAELVAVLAKLKGSAPAPAAPAKKGKNLREITVAHYQKEDEKANKIVRTKRDEALGKWSEGIKKANRKAARVDEAEENATNVDGIIRYLAILNGWTEEDEEDEDSSYLMWEALDSSGGYEDYDWVVDEVVKRLKEQGWSIRKIKSDMKDAKEDGTTIFDDFLE